jgi:hypothetical protein
MAVEPQSLDEPTGGPSVATHVDLDGDKAVIAGIRQQRTELEPFGRTLVIEIPGYQGMLGIEYGYIDSEATETISRAVAKETRSHGGKGITLLASIDTLVEACRRVMIRKDTSQDWRPMPPEPVQFDSQLSETLEFDASSPREVVLGLFGSEHAVVQQYMKLSAWLTNVNTDVDDALLGL